MTAHTRSRVAQGGQKIQWKVVKPSSTSRLKFKMICPAQETREGAHVEAYQAQAIQPGGQPKPVHEDEASSTTSSADLFDRTPSNTETEDTNLSSLAASEHNKPLISISQIHDLPKHYLSVDHNGSARKRVAMTGVLPITSGPDMAVNVPPPSSSLSSISSPLSDLSSSKSDPSGSLVSDDKITRAEAPAKPKTEVTYPASWRAASSIPDGLPWEEYGRQCVTAAQSSRLNPYALHVGEYKLLLNRMSPSHTTAYLNVRNGILRLWTRNPMVSVTEEEAVGCAKHSNHFGLAVFAYRWLVRNGYINFGCVEVSRPSVAPPRGRRSSKQKTIVVIGAGMSGLGCARQLEALVAQYQDHWIDKNEHPPKIIILEGRKRIGGRVYSHPLHSQVKDSLPNGLRNTAELGAQIITGFHNGNPLDAVVRGQLGLHYHLMWDEIVFHDSDGKTVDRERDLLVNKVHNDILERTGDYRLNAVSKDTFEGLPDFIDLCQEPEHTENSDDDLEGYVAGGSHNAQAAPPGFAKLQGKTQVVTGNSTSRTAAQAAKSAGWELRPGISRNHSLNLDTIAKAAKNPNLGLTMDEAVRQYQHLIDLTPQDMRLLNWHYADLEYANAAMVHQLSLSGHDQDMGNEFSGRHSEVVGGYIQVPRGLMMLPHQLDVQFESPVEKIMYSDSQGSALVRCKDGKVIQADKVVLTAPLGVLKAQSIEFEPQLPDWKRGAIDRMGFGVLNKIVLVFERAFWNEQYDMFGMLNDAERKNSLDPDDYAKGRGKFYLCWNCINNSGRPMLIALMSGYTAHAAEVTPTNVLLDEVIERLSRTFAPQPVPAPVEVIVTRWKKDPFTRGTYSFVAPGTEPGDYDVMARPVGNLHFAGEATCGTHPATVHGAYLSGLRAAAEVMDSIIGPVEVPEMLVGEADKAHPVIGGLELVKPKGQVGRPRKDAIRQKKDTRADAVPSVSEKPAVNPYRSVANPRSTVDEEREVLIQSKIFLELGERPLRPARPGVNPFLVYTTENWNDCKAACSAEKQKQTGNPAATATRHEVRAAIGRNWTNLSEELKRPYLERGEAAQKQANEARARYEADVVEWDRRAAEIRRTFKEEPAANVKVETESTAAA